jgi:hypothetical protein
MTPGKRRLIIGSAIAGGVFLIVGLGVGIFLIVHFAGRAAENARFKKHIGDYLAVTEEQPGLGAYLRGRVVVIHVSNNKDGPGQREEVDDEVSPLLPAELRAKSPEDAGTVVVLKWSADVVGVYPAGDRTATALVHTCEARIIDLSLSAIVARQSFRGGDPPVSIAGGREAYGSKPTKEIADWLVSLPREPAADEAASQWTVLFRSDDPAVWNTDSTGSNFAVPMRRVNPAIRYLRLKRLDTDAAIIVPINWKQLMREDRPEPLKGLWWNGTAQQGWGGRHLGIVQAVSDLNGQRGRIGITTQGWYARHSMQNHESPHFARKGGSGLHVPLEQPRDGDDAYRSYARRGPLGLRDRPRGMPDPNSRSRATE